MAKRKRRQTTNAAHSHTPTSKQHHHPTSQGTTKKRKRSSKEAPSKKGQVGRGATKAGKKNKHIHSVKTPIQQILRAMAMILGLFILTMLVLLFSTIDKAEILDQSMEPTLHKQDQLLIRHRQKIERYDLITFQLNKDKSQRFVKRVIGMPGDEVSYQNDQLHLNGQIYEEAYLAKNKTEFYKNIPLKDEAKLNYTEDFDLTDLPGVNKNCHQIPSGNYLVLGDNRQTTNDSREFGLVKEKDVIGVVYKKFGAK